MRDGPCRQTLVRLCLRLLAAASLRFRFSFTFFSFVVFFVSLLSSLLRRLLRRLLRLAAFPSSSPSSSSSFSSRFFPLFFVVFFVVFFVSLLSPLLLLLLRRCRGVCVLRLLVCVFFWIQVSSSSSLSSSSSFVKSGEEFDCSFCFCLISEFVFVCCLFAAENSFCEEVTSCLLATPISRACCCFDHRSLISCRYVGSGRVFFF